MLPRATLGTGRKTGAQNDEEGLPAGAGYESRHYVRGVAVQRNSGTVIAHRRARVSVARRFLHIAEGHACVQGGRFQQSLAGGE